MGGPLVRIESVYQSLSDAEKRVADFTLKNPAKVPFCSVSELAKSAKVSVASLSRLAKELGYHNFHNFKIEIAQQA